MLNVFYYYYYLFYTKVLPDDQPHSTVIFTLGFTYSLIINFMLNIFLAFFFDFALNEWEMIGVFALILVFLYFTYYKSGVGREIVKKEDPKILSSKSASIFLTLSLFIVAVLSMFFSPILTREILANH